MPRYSIFAILFVLVASLGCGSNCKVTGKVTFKDGTPLTHGEVIFETSDTVASGKIQPDGTYTLGTKNLADGVPKGTYAVAVRAMDESGITSGMLPGEAPPPKSLIAKQYRTSSSSGLSCEVKGKTVYDIAVERAED